MGHARWLNGVTAVVCASACALVACSGAQRAPSDLPAHDAEPAPPASGPAPAASSLPHAVDPGRPRDEPVVRMTNMGRAHPEPRPGPLPPQAERRPFRAPEPFAHDPLPVPKTPKTCKRPTKPAALADLPHDAMGYALTGAVLLRHVTIALQGSESVAAGGDACVFLEDVQIRGGEGLGFGGSAVAALERVVIETTGRAALSIGGSAQVLVTGGSFAASEAIAAGGDAVVLIREATLRSATALALGGDAMLTSERNHIGCQHTSAFDECISMGGAAIARLTDEDVHASGRILSVGGSARIALVGGNYTSDGATEAPPMDVMGSGLLLLHEITLNAWATCEWGGGGKLIVEGGKLEPAWAPPWAH